MLLRYLRTIRPRWLVAKVQANIKNHYNNQAFVNRVCQAESAIRYIVDQRFALDAFGFFSEPVANYVIATDLYALHLDWRGLNSSDLAICAMLLRSRIEALEAGLGQFNEEESSFVASRMARWKSSLRAFETRLEERFYTNFATA